MVSIGPLKRFWGMSDFDFTHLSIHPNSRWLVNSFCTRMGFLKYRDKKFGVRASQISSQSGVGAGVNGTALALAGACNTRLVVVLVCSVCGQSRCAVHHQSIRRE